MLLPCEELFLSKSCFSSGKLASRIGFYFTTHSYASLPYQYLIALVKFSIVFKETFAFKYATVENSTEFDEILFSAFTSLSLFPVTVFCSKIVQYEHIKHEVTFHSASWHMQYLPLL